MPNIYDGDKTFIDWVKEVGRDARTLRLVLTDLSERKADWDNFKGTRTLTQIAIDLGRTVGNGTSQAGAATTITLKAADTKDDDFYNNMTIRITGGTGAGQEKTIDDYVNSTKVATVNSAWTTNPDSTSTYAIQKDIDILESAIYNGNKVKRVAFGEIAQSPSKDLFLNMRSFT